MMHPSASAAVRRGCLGRDVGVRTLAMRRGTFGTASGLERCLAWSRTEGPATEA